MTERPERFAIIVAPRALADLVHIREYLIVRSPTGADSVREAIENTINHSSYFPRLGRDRPEFGLRSIDVPCYDHTICYRVAGVTIEVVHVRGDDRRTLQPGQV